MTPLSVRGVSHTSRIVIPLLFSLGSPDYVLDCIDDPNTKAELLVFCHRRGLRVLSSLGAGAKADPTALLLGDISQVACAYLPLALLSLDSFHSPHLEDDPLGRKMRTKLKEQGITSGIDVSD